MEKDIQPLGTKVLLKVGKKEEKHGSLFIPETVGRDSHSVRCSIVAVGSLCTLVEVGQVVYVDASTMYDSVGSHLDEDHVVVEEKFILAWEKA